MVTYEKEVEAEIEAKRAPVNKILGALQNDHLTEVARLGAPADGCFAYPYEKRRTKANTEARRLAEHNLDMLWASVDRLMSVKAGNLEGTATRRLLTQARMLQRTPEWVDKEASTEAGKTMEVTAMATSLGTPPHSHSHSHAAGSALSAFHFGLSDKPS
jgi:hypothetical protein